MRGAERGGMREWEGESYAFEFCQLESSGSKMKWHIFYGSRCRDFS